MPIFRLLSVSSLLLAAACSIVVEGPSVPAGNVDSHPLEVHEMLAGWDTSAGGQRELKLFFSETAGACAAFNGSHLIPNMSGIGVTFRKMGSRARPVSPGTYDIVFDANDAFPPGSQLDEVTAEFLRFNASCGESTRIRANGGSITVTSLTDSDVGGNIDIVYPNGERVSGPFHASFCGMPNGGTCGG